VTNSFNGDNEGSSSTSVTDGQGAKFAYFSSGGGATGNSPDMTSTENQEQQAVSGGSVGYFLRSDHNIVKVL